MAAAKRAAVAVCASLFDFGEVEKKLANLATRGEGTLRGGSHFSVYGGGGSIVVVVTGELLAKGLNGLRGIANGPKASGQHLYLDQGVWDRRRYKSG